MTRRVAVILHQTVPWLAECVAGIRRYATESGGWHLLNLSPGFQRFGNATSLPRAHQWKGDGIIALVDDERELRAAAKAGIPVVNLGSWHAKSFGIPRVTVDHHHGGQLAARHLLDLGLSHLAVFGWKEPWYLERRRQGFLETAHLAGAKCELKVHSSRLDADKSWYRRIGESVRWMKTLPRPCGVFAMHDYMAQLIAEACHEANLRIPDDVALIGMDNDETICEHLVPKLTSVGRNSQQVGWEAAALLDRLMRGKRPPAADILVPPSGVFARASTDRLYAADPLIQKALDAMRKNLRTPFNIEHLAGSLGVSKRTLEMRFREHLQSSPHNFLTARRIRHAQGLIQTQQGKTLEATAAASGFGSVQAFRKAFLRVTGESLASFRRRQPSGGLQEISNFVAPESARKRV